MLEHLRGPIDVGLAPLVRWFIRLGVRADYVSLIGAGLFCVVALILIPRGHLAIAAVILAVLALSDVLDGQVARLSGRLTEWGAWLDSTVDRVADGALLVAIAGWFAIAGQPLWVMITGWALVAGQLTSYVKARAESFGWQASGGIASRADRIAIALLGLLVAGLGLPVALPGSMVVLAVLSTITVGQRGWKIRRQAVAVAQGVQPAGEPRR